MTTQQIPTDSVNTQALDILRHVLDVAERNNLLKKTKDETSVSLCVKVEKTSGDDREVYSYDFAL